MSPLCSSLLIRRVEFARSFIVLAQEMKYTLNISQNLFLDTNRPFANYLWPLFHCGSKIVHSKFSKLPSSLKFKNAREINS